MSSSTHNPGYQYLAITQGTADWLQGKAALIDTIYQTLCTQDPETAALSKTEFVDGPVHIAANNNLSVIALWNVDYMTGLDDERWAFIRIDKTLGLSNLSSIGNAVLERCIYVINHRLQGLMLEGTLYHRNYPNGSHTYLAARGTGARKYSVGYFEKVITSSNVENHAIIFVGPGDAFEPLAQAAENASTFLPEFIDTASKLVAKNRGKPAADTSLFIGLRKQLASHRPQQEENEYHQVQVSINTNTIGKDAHARSHSLTYTRARYRVTVVVSSGSSLTPILRDAEKQLLLNRIPLTTVSTNS